MTDEYDELFRLAYPRVVAMGLAMSASRHVSQELAQETLLRAHHGRDELAADDSRMASVNMQAGRTVANSLLVKVGAGRRVCVSCSIAAHLVVDVNAYTNGAPPVALNPARLVETRPTSGPPSMKNSPARTCHRAPSRLH
jgi:DNA-directed RNA polymerase specialized sigma24 family protein